MIFGRSEFLYFLAILPFLALLFFLSYRFKENFLQKSGLKRVYKSYPADRRFFKKLFFVLALGFLILSLASPRFGAALEKGERKGRDIYFLIDVSNSMNATDIKPSRLEATKQIIYGLLEKMSGDRVGVAVFAGKCQIICPLTDDYDAVGMFVDSVDTDMISMQGTDLGEAIKKVVKAFPEEDGGYRTVIVFSDGEDFGENVKEGIKLAKENGVIIFTVGIGSKSGAPIPVYDAEGNVIGFKKDREGNIVVSKLNEKVLKETADKTGGAFFIIRNNLQIEPLIKKLNKLSRKLIEDKGFVKLKDRYYYPLIAALIFLTAFLVL